MKLKYPQLVIEQLALNGGDVAAALRESFHKVDVLLEDLVSAVLVLYCVFADCVGSVYCYIGCGICVSHRRIVSYSSVSESQVLLLPFSLRSFPHPLSSTRTNNYFPTQQYASLLRELRTQPNPCDKIGANTSSNPRPSQMSAPLEGTLMQFD